MHPLSHVVFHRKWYRVFAVSATNGWSDMFEMKASALFNRDGTYDIVVLQLDKVGNVCVSRILSLHGTTKPVRIVKGDSNISAATATPMIPYPFKTHEPDSPRDCELPIR